MKIQLCIDFVEEIKKLTVFDLGTGSDWPQKAVQTQTQNAASDLSLNWLPLIQQF